MGRTVTTFSDGSFLEYDSGAFDDWCVYLTRPHQAKYAPRDYQYFDRLKQYALRHGSAKLYRDFVSIYDRTTSTLSDSVFNFIKQIAQDYGDDETDVAIDFSIIYMGMVAEENKAFTKLGKRVKRLGVHQVLNDGMSSYEAANFSRGMGWRDIDAICRGKGF